METGTFLMDHSAQLLSIGYRQMKSHKPVNISTTIKKTSYFSIGFNKCIVDCTRF
ncbi:unnamed protein product [Schistosoma mattheei]|uniref:Uncharacterized protein n=1 Tax=Schistosoma mattheei TaxID=31246 RepID=A0A183PT43_9TREM|nr:unnamed protein product [Schistosoma mattheei]